MTENAQEGTRPRAEATRALLMDAAVAAFAEKGFHGTTTRDISTAAGMSPAALYVHHRSKEELLYLISLSGHKRTLSLVQRGIAAGGSTADRLHRVVRDFIMDHAERHTLGRVVNYELAALAPEHISEIRKIRQQISAEVRHLVEQGVKSGEFDSPNPQMAAVALLSLGIDISRWYRDDGAWASEDIADEYADMALRIVGARRIAPDHAGGDRPYN